MRVTIAVAAFAAVVSAASSSCSEWKERTYEKNKAETGGWTKEVDGDTTTYYDMNGNEITVWDNFQGYE